jgi:YD repeat-containing protein
LFQSPTLGNRTISTQTITSTLVTNYSYDAANRLTSVNGQAYTWDNNGNLLDDGSKTCAYDQANRLTGMNASGLTWSATYIGDGARVEQVVNDARTKYTLNPSLHSGQALLLPLVI